MLSNKAKLPAEVDRAVQLTIGFWRAMANITLPDDVMGDIEANTKERTEAVEDYVSKATTLPGQPATQSDTSKYFLQAFAISSWSQFVCFLSPLEPLVYASLSLSHTLSVSVSVLHNLHSPSSL